MDNEMIRVSAVMVPVGYPGQGPSRERLARLDREFAPLIGVRALFIRQQGTGHFLSPDGGDTLLHPTHSPLAGRPRYDWLDRGDGVLYGTIRPD